MGENRIFTRECTGQVAEKQVIAISPKTLPNVPASVAKRPIISYHIVVKTFYINSVVSSFNFLKTSIV